MVLQPNSSWSLRGVTFLVWALAAASAAYWGLRWRGAPVSATSSAAVAQPVSIVSTDSAAMGRLLGAVTVTPVTPSLASRFSLVGVAAGTQHSGAALIAIDGKPARPFRVGAKVEEGLILQSVSPRRAALGPSADGAATLTLDLPQAKR